MHIHFKVLYKKKIIKKKIKKNKVYKNGGALYQFIKTNPQKVYYFFGVDESTTWTIQTARTIPKMVTPKISQ